VNQKPTDLGIPNRFKLKSSRFSSKNKELDYRLRQAVPPAPDGDWGEG
jgi:hypothetical protein